MTAKRPTRRTKQQVVGEFRRAEILDAARRVFAQKGFAGGVMDEIASEAGIAKGTVYLYFRSKIEVYRALLEHDMRQLQATTIERMEAAADVRAKIHAFLLARLTNADERREFFRIMDSERTNLHISRKQYREFLEEPVKRLKSALDYGIQQGSVRPVATEAVAWLIVDAARGSIQRRLLQQPPPSAADEAAFLLDFLWGALATRGGDGCAPPAV